MKIEYFFITYDITHITNLKASRKVFHGCDSFLKELYHPS